MTTAYIIYPDWERLGRDGRWTVGNGEVVADCFYSVLTHVKMEVESETHGDILGRLFEQFNIGDHGGLRCRSMSVGDIVVLGRKSYLCKPAGWEEVDLGWMPELIDSYDMTIALKTYEKNFAEAKAKYPNACELCCGAGLKYISGSHWEEPSTDPCPECLGKGKCPICGTEIPEAGDYFKCSKCDYDEEGECAGVLPAHPFG